MPNVLKAGAVTFAQGDAISIGGPYVRLYYEPEFLDEPEVSPESSETEKTMSEQADAKQTEPERQDTASLTEQARDQADLLILQAKSEARNILEDAREQVGRLRKIAEEDGRREGYQEGLAKGNAVAETLKEEAKKEKENMMAQLESQAVDLIARTLEKLVGNTARIHPEVILHMVKAGLTGITLTGEITVHVSPEEYETVSENLTKIVPASDAKVQVVSDASLSSMSCLIETPFGSIDSSLDQQFRLLKEDLYHILNA